MMNPVGGTHIVKHHSHPALFSTRFLVGHNIKFDLLYLMRDPEFRDKMHEYMIWDTMVAEYVLSGQREKFASLDSLATKYKCSQSKGRVIDGAIAAGKTTEDIAIEELTDYLISDLTITHHVFKAQLELAQQAGKLVLIGNMMDSVQATTEIEWNGMYFNKLDAQKHALNLNEELDTLGKLFRAQTDVPDDMTQFNIYSTDHCCKALFGGEWEVEKSVLKVDDAGSPVVFKTGARKGQQKTEIIKKNVPSLGVLEKPAVFPTTPSGKPRMDEEALRSLPKHTAVDILLEHREKAKQLTTYFNGYSALTWQDNCIHPNYQHVATDTGRLSCSGPNLQNVTRAEE
jgi:DNA polymerase I-like protein with 3'-5' exonuclease and polymerase domains